MNTAKLFGISQQSISQIMDLAPDFIKEADIKQVLDSEPEYWADDVRKQFPIDTPAMVWLSAAGLIKNANKIEIDRYQRIKERIDKAAGFFGIEGDIGRLEKELNAEEDLSSLPDSMFAVVLNDNGRVRRLYPMRDAMEVKKAAEYFIEHRHQMPWHIRHQFAVKVLEAAEQMSASIGNYMDPLLKSACDGISAASEALSQVRRRIRWAENTSGAKEYIEPLKKLAESIEHSGADVFSARVSLVELLDRLDRKFGWEKYYDKNNMPEDFLFGITRRDVELVKNGVVENHGAGFAYTIDEIISKVPKSVLLDAFGKDNVEKMCDDFGSLSASKMSTVLDGALGNTFHKIAVAYGVIPCAKFEAAVSLPDDVKKRIAAAHDRSRRGSLWSRIDESQSSCT